MGAREWAAIGNVLKISAAFGFLASLFIADSAYNRRLPADYVPVAWAVAIGTLLLSVLLWNLKGPLVRGSWFVRVPVGLYMLVWVIASLGTGLIWIGIVYLFTGNPSAYDAAPKGKAPKGPKAPRNWSPTAKIGPAGAMLYRDSTRVDASGIFDSYTPVQVVDRQASAARVVAANGESGWIDLRSLTETA